MTITFYILIFVLGSAIASFFNAQIYRIEKEIPWSEFFTAPSSCESCAKHLSFLELMPIVGFLITKGKCKSCKYKIPLLYPLSELIFGISFVLMWSLQLSLVYWFLVLAIYFLALYDAQYKGFPKVIMNTFLVISFIYFLVVALISGFTNITTGIYIAVPIISIIALMNLFKKSFGGGDILVILMLSFVLSWEQLLSTLWFAVIIGGVYASIMLIMKRLKRKDSVPFVPFIYIGLLLSFLIVNDFSLLFEYINILWYS